MIQLIMIACLLLMAAPVGAESQDLTINGTRLLVGTTYCQSPDIGITCTPGRAIDQWDIALSHIRINKASFDAMLKDYPEAKLRVMLVEDPCLARMEEAMRAMDYWLYPPLNGTIKMSAKIQHGLNTQWDDAKRECWRKQPEGGRNGR